MSLSIQLNTITRAFVSGCVSGVVLFLVFLLLTTCSPLVAPVGAETDSYGYNEKGQYDGWSSSAPQRDAWTPASPNSNRYTEQDREAYRAYSNRETSRSNQEVIDSYYESLRQGSRASEPVPAWKDEFTVQRPRGGVTVCQRGPNGYVFCR